ncbi:hypothetical protein KY331_06320 [Candidatus Woesearchaeota archaeon]|nr:hypothetical protein [Candidatus Woesearchaeota archaeon]
MRCYLCGRTAVIKKQKNRVICNKCFCWLFEKRIRKQTRLDKSFSSGDRILVIGEVAKYLVKSITKDMNVKLVSKNYNKKIIEWTLDDELNQFVKGMFEGKGRRKEEKKVIKILKNVTDEEVKLFAKIKGLKFKPNKKDKAIQKFLDSVQAKYPNAKYNLLRNVSELRTII